MEFTLTLTRWHKVAERINAAVKEREAQVKAAFTETVISAWNKEGIEEKAAEIAQRAASNLALIEAGYRAVATIRAALGVRNAQVGVSAKLAEAEVAQRAVSFYRAIIDGQTIDMVRPHAVPELAVSLNSEPETLFRRANTAITLQIASAETITVLREKLVREQARATRLLDDVADLNRDKLAVELPAEVIEIAGLAA